MFRIIYKVRIIFLMGAVLTACSPSTPDLPSNFSASGFVDQGDFKIAEVGDLPLNDSVGKQTSGEEWFHGYTLQLNQNDKLNFIMEGLDFGYFAVFGPKQKAGKWGDAKLKETIEWNPETNQFNLAMEFIAEEEGTYLAVIGSPWKSEYKYSLGLTCTGGNCIEKGMCVHYEGTDMFGKPNNSYFAANIKNYEEGQDLLKERGNFVNGGIDKSACEKLNTLCSEIEEPVCGRILDAAEKTYPNVCLFKAEVLKNIDEKGEIKGTWNSGGC